MRLKLRKLSWVDAAELLALLSIPCFAAPYLERLILFPSSEMPDQTSLFHQIQELTHAKKIDVKISLSNHHTLSGWLFRLPNSPRVFLVSHGNAGNISNRIFTALLLLKTGSSVFLYDYEGYGLSDGRPSIEALKADGQSAYDFLLKDQSYDGRNIIDYGESIGGAVAVDIAKHNRVGALVIQSGFTSLSEAIKDKLMFMRLYPKSVFQYVELNNETYLKSEHPPLLLIHGDSDGTLPVKYAEANFAAASQPKELLVIKGAGHDDVTIRDPRKFVQTLATFVNRYLPSRN